MRALLEPEFEIGEPTNEEQVWYGRDAEGKDLLKPCRVPGVAYDGSDPNVQFPVGYHVKAGLGDKDNPYAKWYHQAIDHFEPARVKLARHSTADEFPLSPQGEEALLLRFIGSAPNAPGAGSIARSVEPTAWADGQAFVYGMWLRPSSNENPRFYLNAEIRGKLGFVPLAEGALGLHVGLTNYHLRVMWWHNGEDKQSHALTQKRTEAILLAPNEWYHLRLILLPRMETDTWDFRVEFARQHAPRVRVNSPTPITQLEQITGVFVGDERAMDEQGGVWYVHQLNARVTETAEEVERWRKGKDEAK